MSNWLALAQTIFLMLLAQPVMAQSLRGDADAIAAAANLLGQVGGAEVWSKPVFVTREIAYLANGEQGTVEIERDFVNGLRHLRLVTPTVTIVQWTGSNDSWRSRNGVVTIAPPHRLLVERQIARQEPYAIFHRIAIDDPTLRVEQRDERRQLVFFDNDERVLSWFNLDAKGGLIGWGSHGDGVLDQFFYGPLHDVGNVNLPKFGSSTTGGYRFEYISGTARAGTIVPPQRDN
jgi:hypothetical protein